MTKPWQSEARGRGRREGKSGPREQGAVESSGSWGTVSGKQFLSWGPLCPRIKGPGLAWLLEWASDTRAMEIKPSPFWGKG